MYQSIYDIARYSCFKSECNMTDQQSYDYLVALRNYFSASFPLNQKASYSYMNNFKWPYLPYSYYNRFKNWNNCGYRDGYMCFYEETTNTLNGVSRKVTHIYVYDYYHDQYIDLGVFLRVNPTDNTELHMMNNGKCGSSTIFIKCGTSYLDDFMYSNKSSDIFITSLYFFIPILLLILAIKVLKKGLFR